MISLGCRAVVNLVLFLVLCAASLYGQVITPNPVPLINQPLAPTSVAPGSGGFTLTVNGTGFLPPTLALGSVVYWNGAARTTTFVSSSKLTASITADDTLFAGTASVTVVNPAPGGGISNVAFFTVTNPLSLVSFSTSPVSVGTDPYFVATGDFNNDQQLDLAVINRTSSDLYILMGLGDGTFQSPNVYSTGTTPRQVAAGDFNGDGNLDLVTTSEFSGTVSIFLGNGDGTFQAKVDYSAGAIGSALGVCVGDFNADGNLDVAVSGSGVAVLLGNGDGTLQLPTILVTSNSNLSVATGDLNGDGKLDLVTGNYFTTTPNVSVFLGNGDGTFQAKTDYPTNANNYGLVLADFNGDGKLDIVTLSYSTNSLSLLIGNGDATFQPKVDISNSSSSILGMAADVNGDNKLDLVVASYNGNVSIHLGSGNGTFQPFVDYDGGGNALAVASGDFDGDGKLDLVVVNNTLAKVTIMKQVLQPAVQLSPTALDFGFQLVGAESAVQQVTLTNTGTGPLNFAVLGGGFNVQVSTGNTTPSPDFYETNNNCVGPIAAAASCTFDVLFKPSVIGSLTAVVRIGSDAPGSPHFINLSGTGISSGLLGGLPSTVDFGDVAVNSSASQTVTINNPGAGTLGISSIQVTGSFSLNENLTTCGSTLASTASCDITIIFTPVSSGPSSGQLKIFHDGSGSPAVANLIGNGVSPNAVPQISQPLVPTAAVPAGAGFPMTVNGTGFVSGSVVRWNGSARVTTFVSNSQLSAVIPASDLASASTASITVVNPAPGGGTSNAAFFQIIAPTVSVSAIGTEIPTGAQPRFVVSGDFNKDGVIDLVAVNHLDNSFSYFQGVGDGTFAAPSIFAMGAATGALPIDGVVGDFNGDGNLDLAITHPKSTGLGFGNTVTIHLGDGNGSFTAPGTVFTTGSSDTGITTADFNEDGKLDLAIGSCDLQSVFIHSGNGDGTFTQTAQISVGGCSGGAYLRLAPGDFNLDGHLDLVAVNSSANRVAILLGDGAGGFGSPAYYAVGTFPWAVVVADFNGDGKLDLAVGNDDGTVSVLLGNGNGTFQSQVPYPANTTPISLVTGDFNGDGKLDLGVADRGSNTVSILLGNGDGTFQPKTDSATGTLPTVVTSADFNGDGRLDLATANASANTVSILRLLPPAPAVQLSTTSLDFGSTLVGSIGTSLGVSLGNTGTADLRIGTVTLTGANPGDFDLNDGCTGMVLAPGGRCNIAIRFKPTGTGTRIAQLGIPSDAASSPDKVDLTGKGIAATGTGVVSLAPTSLGFGNQRLSTESTAQLVTLANASTTDTLTLQGIAAAGDFHQTNTCIAVGIPTGSLAPGTSCQISVTFLPTTLGLQTNALTIASSAATSPDAVILSGTGTGTPAVTVGPAVSFAGNPLNITCPTKPVTVANTGNMPLDITSIVATAPFSQTNNCPATLGVGLSCTVNVKFTPTVVGPATGSLKVTTNPATTGNSVLLSGNGTPACSLVAKVRSVTVLRGTDVQNFDIEDAKPSCSPVNLKLTCSVDNPAACLLNPAVIPPSGASTLKVSNLKRVGSDALQVLVTSTSEFRQASELVTVRFADFQFTQSPDVLTVAAGGTGSYAVAVRPVNGLSGNVALSCSGVPRGATCTVEPSSITLDGASVEQVKVKVSTTGRAGAWPMAGIDFNGGGRQTVLLLVALLMLLTAAMAYDRRKRTKLLSAVTLLAMLLWASCGGGGGSMSFSSGGTPAGSYTLTITGTYSSSTGATPGTLTNATSVTLKVN